MPTINTILVTGAAGFVGQHVCAAFAAAYPAARIIGTGLSAHPGMLQLDITDRAALRATIAAAKPDICLHLAAISSIAACRADPEAAWAINLQGSLNLAHAILAEAPACRLIHISSAECYGRSFVAGAPLDETAPLAPMNLYAATKAASDLALGALVSDGLRLIRLRPFNHTGPGQAESFVIPAFAGQIARIEAGLSPPEIKVGALDPARDFLDIRDICAAYTACAARDADLPADLILNIASGSAVKIGEILQKLLGLATIPIAVVQDPARLRPTEIMHAAGNAARAHALLGWQPAISLDETLASVLAYARAAI